MRRLKAYVDTSVVGAIRDEEFAEATTRFFDQSREGRFDLVLSALVAEELVDAPGEVQAFYEDILQFAETASPSDQAVLLHQAYLDAGVIGARWAYDALHVATATVLECDMIVSWNFRHIVSFDKRRRYNAVNVLHGYDEIDILTPAEVIDYEEDV